jgi:hypothetical protein
MYALAQASVPNSKILLKIEERLDGISTEESWKKFVKESSKQFPEMSAEKSQTHVVVTQEKLRLDGESFSLGVGYRQALIKAPLDRVKRILNTPELFKPLFGLDQDSAVDPVALSPDEIIKRVAFKARIFKKVSLIPNQDYLLAFTNTTSGELWFQRAKLVEDKEKFALRDNLKALEVTKDGVIFREVSIIYGLKWYVQFFGPTVREVMNKELTKVTDAIKCLAEKTVDITEAEAKICWEPPKKKAS